MQVFGQLIDRSSCAKFLSCTFLIPGMLMATIVSRNFLVQWRCIRSECSGDHVSEGFYGFYDDQGFPMGEGFRKVHRPIDMKDPNAYALMVEGDSMSPMIEKGWIVYVCPNHSYENGDLVVVALNNDEVMIKKLRKKDDMLVLQSINPSYEPLVLVPDGFRFIHKVCLIKPK